MFGRSKALDLANRSQYRHARDDPKARQLHDVGHALCPGFLVAHLRHFFSDPANLLLDVGPVLHLQFQLELLHLGQPLVLLPESILLIEPFAPFMLQVMAMRHTVHPVHDLRVGLHQLSALGQQLAHLTNMRRRHPHIRNQVGCQQSCQNERIAHIRLHPRIGDLLHLDGIGHHHSFHQWLQQIIHMPGIRGGFKDHMIAWLADSSSAILPDRRAPPAQQ